jgi:drug/metabolite transporter (DMT)-like permease
MVLTGAVLFGFNGAVSKVVLAAGLSSPRMTEVRSTGAFLVLLVALLVAAPRLLRVRRDELPFLAAFGAIGLASVQLFYFLSIHRLPLGIALLLEYTAPILVALWARFVLHQQVRGRLWVALGLALFGLSLVVEVWTGVTLSGIGLTFGAITAVSFAAYILMAEHEVGRRDPVSLTCYGFLFASILLALIQPWWGFPFSFVGERISLLGRLASHDLPVWGLLLWVIVPGTVLPFLLVIGSLRHIPATRAAIAAMAEPVAAAVIGWAWLGESLGPSQLLGGLIVIAAIGLAQTAR